MQAPVAGANPAAGASVMSDPNGGMAAPQADPNAVPAAPALDPTMGGDMNGDGMPDDPNAMGMEEPAMGATDDQAIMDAVTQLGLSGDEADAAKGYIQYLLKNPYNDEADNEASTDMGMAQQPMMETVIFTKKQLEKVNEGVGFTDDEKKEDKKGPSTKKNKGWRKKSPFGAKKFGQSSL